MLEISNQVDRSGILPQYTGVLGTAQPRGTWSRMTSKYPYVPVTFLEPVADIKAWMNISQDQGTMDKIKTLIPGWAYGKTLMVYWSGFTPMEPNQESATWIRTPTVYPDDTVLSYIKEYIPGPDPDLSYGLEYFMSTEGCTWFPVPDAPEETKLGVIAHINEDMDIEEIQYVLHIAIGSFMIHLVDVAGVDEFKNLASSLFDNCGILPIFAGYIHTGVEEDLPLGAVTSPDSWLGRRQLSRARNKTAL